MSETSPHPPYERAPITEAVIQLAVSGGVKKSVLASFVGKLKSEYPNVQPMQNVSVNVEATGGNVEVSKQDHGFRLANNFQTKIIIANETGVITSRLAPYPGWEELRDAAHDAWVKWKKAGGPQSVVRIGVRFINRIDIPISREVELLVIDDYVVFAPKIGHITKKPLNGYILQVVVPTENKFWTATVTSTTLGQSVLPDHHSIILDIDVYRTTDLSSREDRLWETVDEARPIKNQLFEACITDKARMLFKK